MGFEFLSIFIAVVSAFALNNWNENRKDRIAETKILEEILHGLDKDLSDINENLNGHKTGLTACSYFNNAIQGQTVSSDSLSYHFINLTRDFISIQNTSGYTSLKSKGLELVRNDSLRTKIISLYEFDYTIIDKLEEEYYEMQFQENYFRDFNTILSPNFEFDLDGNPVRLIQPLKITEKEKKLLLSDLWKIKGNRYYIMHNYVSVQAKTIALKNDIMTELKQH